MPDYMTQAVLGQEAYRYLAAFLIILASLVFRKVFDQYIARKLRSWSEKTRFEYDDILISALTPPVNALVLSLGLFFAIFSFDLPREPYDIPRFVTQTYHVTLSLIAVWAAYRLTELLTEFTRQFFSRQDDHLAKQFTPLVRQAIRATVLIFGGVMIVQNLGYSVSSLLAGLGIGGLAIALAAQDTVANVFGTVVMFTDKPFRVGDWIRFGEVDGFVESIGFRSIRLRTWSNTVMVIPNKKITSEIIENCSSMNKRRVKMTIGVQYDSPVEKVRQLVGRIRSLLEHDPEVHQEYMLVRFTDFGPSSLDVFLYYFTVSTVWAEYLEVRERINLSIMEIVHELGLSFAFPSRTVYFGNSPALGDGRSPGGGAGVSPGGPGDS
ncbi:MAG: mechanosensitive ion channel family protein [Candidatus Glassbacteria bacterium]|nr:mechanosensitive ion channel family protein [Candidatus Glassbacteria bacterium]